MSSKLPMLLNGYLPFLGLICFANFLFALTLIVLSATGVISPCLMTVVLLILLTSLLQIGYALTIAFAHKESRSEDELSLHPEQIERLRNFVADIAMECNLPAPHLIYFTANDVAYVYEKENGQRVLVFGLLAISAFSQKSLGSIIAHELAHFGAGDTEQSRLAKRRVITMAIIDHKFRATLATFVNPFAWLILLYHRWFCQAHASKSRKQEYEADAHSAELAGIKATASALIFIHVTQYLPMADLGRLIEVFVRTDQPLEGLFAEQARIVKQSPEWEWKEALQKALREKPKPMDSHPTLKQRLKALGISPKKAMSLAMSQKQSGAPATDLVLSWKDFEEKVSAELIIPFKAYYAEKMEFARMMQGHRY